MHHGHVTREGKTQIVTAARSRPTAWGKFCRKENIVSGGKPERLGAAAETTFGLHWQSNENRKEEDVVLKTSPAIRNSKAYKAGMRRRVRFLFPRGSLTVWLPPPPFIYRKTFMPRFPSSPLSQSVWS